MLVRSKHQVRCAPSRYPICSCLTSIHRWCSSGCPTSVRAAPLYQSPSGSHRRCAFNSIPAVSFVRSLSKLPHLENVQVSRVPGYACYSLAHSQRCRTKMQDGASSLRLARFCNSRKRCPQQFRAQEGLGDVRGIYLSDVFSMYFIDELFYLLLCDLRLNLRHEILY